MFPLKIFYTRETLIAGRGERARINQDFTVVRMVVRTDDTEVLPVDKISGDSGMVGTRNSDSMSCDHQKTRWKKPASLVTLASAIIRLGRQLGMFIPCGYFTWPSRMV